MIRTLAAALVTSTCIVALATPAAAQTREYNIPPGSLKAALDAYVRQSGREIVYRADEVRSARSRGARGQLSADAALANLLAGSSFTTRLDGNLIAIVKAGNGATAEAVSSSGEAVAGRAAADSESVEIVVTGSHIRGAQSASPTLSVSQQQMRNGGFADLGEVARSIPQNFSGGQNPGIRYAGGLSNVDVNGASSLNLRGLGPDATLTLLNGHRLAYSGTSQAVDVSAIPMAAVDRLEVVTDGSSAIYGSDAVGGVANIILKRDYSGLNVETRQGVSTSGGNRQQQYSLVGGTVWSDGGILAALDYKHSSAISARQRSYTSQLGAEETLLPSQKAITGLLSARQNISDHIEFAFDGLLGRRETEVISARNVPDYRQRGSFSRRKLKAYTVAPSVNIELPHGWRASIGAVHAEDNTDFTTDNYASNRVSSVNIGRYHNKLTTAEINAEGAVWSLPAGDVRLSLGGGYRRNSLAGSLVQQAGAIIIPAVSISGRIESYYGYGEVYAPLVAPGQDIPAVHRLAVTGALRYETYPGLDEVVTPRIGVIYEPVRDLTVKGSWGQSFKAPTLYQSHNLATAYLDDSSYYASTSLPADAVVLLLDGGNPDLKPERARTWSATVGYEPDWLSGLEIEVSYFNIAYKDRAVLPVANQIGAIENPAYASLIAINPTPSDVLAALALAPAGMQNYSSSPFDPANIAAIIDSRQHNALRQSIEGVDIRGRYAFSLGARDTLMLDGQGSYLSSDQDLNGSANMELASYVYNPPHWRVRAGLSWSRDVAAVNLFVNYLGPLRTRAKPAVGVDSMTTVDLTARYRWESKSPLLNGFAISASLLNAFNIKPPYMPSSAAYIPNYDPTNHSPVGRVVAFTLSKAL